MAEERKGCASISLSFSIEIVEAVESVEGRWEIIMHPFHTKKEKEEEKKRRREEEEQGAEEETRREETRRKLEEGMQCSDWKEWRREAERMNSLKEEGEGEN